jgi:anti-sigma28 factor (negative regulator of flagellin synthesis)
MKINGNDPIHEVERAAPIAPTPALATRPDRVTVERNPNVQAVASAASSASGARAVRFRQLETAIKAGTYRPDPSQVADQILDAAAIDAKLSTLFTGQA